jgi:hypothetical protein
MKNLITKLIFLPIVAFFPMIFSVAIIGSFWDIRKMEWLFPDRNAWQVYVGWIVILAISVIIHHFRKNKNNDQELEH